MENGFVKLKSKEGEAYSIAIDRLSPANQRYIKNLQANPTDQPAAPLQVVGQPNAAAGDDAQPVTKAMADNLTQTKSLYGIRWEPMDDLLTEPGIPQTNKPIFWFRVLGDLEGFM